MSNYQKAIQKKASLAALSAVASFVISQILKTYFYTVIKYQISDIILFVLFCICIFMLCYFFIKYDYPDYKRKKWLRTVRKVRRHKRDTIDALEHKLSNNNSSLRK